MGHILVDTFPNWFESLERISGIVRKKFDWAEIQLVERGPELLVLCRQKML
jgi:hypothetical protein